MELAAVQRLADAGASALLPPRIADAAALDGPLVALDVLDLEPGAVGVLLAGREHLITPIANGRRAVAGDGVASRLVDAIARGEVRGRFRCEQLGPRPDPPAAIARMREVTIDVDQSNESTVVDDAVVLKLYPRTTAGPQPGLTLPAHLAAVGFPDTPAPVGAMRWAGEGSTDEVLVASAVAFLPGARDGWEWFVDGVLGAVDATGPWPVADAAALGTLTGRFHAAMATPSPVLPDPVTRAPAASWHAAAVATLEGAIAETDGPEGERLRAIAPAARAALDGLDLVGDSPVLRIHGDLHVGQVLRWSGGDALSDFDGNPLAPAHERNAPGPAARDVASMARAIDHVGRICQRRRPGREDDVRAWIADAREAFLAAYRSAAPPGVFDERLLLPLEVAQECHEYRYAAAYLPRWRYVPDLALPELLERAG